MTPLRCKSSAGKIAIPSAYFLPAAGGRLRGEPIFAPELPPSAGTANVRLVPAEIRSAATLDAPILYSEPAPPPGKTNTITAKYIMFNGRLLFIGDHVAIRGDDAQIYFAIIHDFWMIPPGQKYVKLQWLLPKNQFALEIDGPKEKIDPSYFNLGPMHDRAEQIESIMDVFFSPQLLRRPLEGPSPVPQVPSPVPSPSERRSSIETSLLEGIMFTSQGGIFPSQEGEISPSQKEIPPFQRDKRILSDSEIELGKMPISGSKEFAIPRKVIPITNILDDVEMAHLLCSMS